MTREEIIQIVEEASTRSIIMFLEREDNDTYPNALPNARIVRDNVVFSTQPTMKDGSAADGRMRRSKEDLLEGYTGFSIGTFRGNGTQVDAWTDPVLAKIGRDGAPGANGKPGEDGIGRDGVDGTSIEYIFKRFIDEVDYNENATNPDDGDHTEETGGIPEEEGWNDHPEGIDLEHKIEAMCYRHLDVTTNKGSLFEGPYKGSVWGHDGRDGDGIEYIFRCFNSNFVDDEEALNEQYCRERNLGPPTNPENPDDAAIINSTAYQSRNTEYVPEGGSDDPTNVSSDAPFQFVSKRKYNGIDKVWGPFCTPSLWDKYMLANVGGFKALAFTRSYASDVDTYVMTGGSPEHPWPTRTVDANGNLVNIEWHDTTPDGVAPVWVTMRFFVTSGEELESSWSPAVCGADTPDFQSEYSNDFPGEEYLQNPAMYKLPSLNDFIDPSHEGEGIDEHAGRMECERRGLGHGYDSEKDDEGDDDQVLVNAMYSATCSRNNNVWSDGQIFKSGAENGISYKTFTIYKACDSSSVTPARPSGGHWNVLTDTLENVPSGWSTTAPGKNTGNGSSSAQFESTEGNITGEWSTPQLENTHPLLVSGVTDGFYAAASDEIVTTPPGNPNATRLNELGWFTNAEGGAPMSQEKPKRWRFTRYEYDDGTIFDTEASIVRWLNAEVQVDTEEIARDVEERVSGQITNLNTRLSKIVKTDGTFEIDKNSGILKALMSYKDNTQTSFADIIANAAEATIKTVAGSEIDNKFTTAGTTINGLVGEVNTHATQLQGIGNEPGSVKSAMQNIASDAITTSVARSHYVGKVTYPADSSDYHKVEYKSYTKDEYREEPGYISEGYAGKTIDSYEKVLSVDEMSFIKQTADQFEIGIAGEVEGVITNLAYLKIFKDKYNPTSGRIELGADEITLNGNVVANSLSSGDIRVQNSTGSIVTIIGPSGIKTNNAVLDTRMYAKEGFFGTYNVTNGEHVYNNTETPTMTNGIKITSNGLVSYKNNQGFIPSGSTPGFELTGDGVTIKTSNGSVISNNNIDITGKITATSGKIGGWNIDTSKLYSGSGSSYVALDSSNGGTYTFGAGATDAASAPFSVKRDGTVNISGYDSIPKKLDTNPDAETGVLRTMIGSGYVNLMYNGVARARFAIENNDVVLKFFNTSGQEMYNLGPSGFRDKDGHPVYEGTF